MSLTHAFVPRDAALAKRLVLVLTLVASAVTIAFAFLAPPPAAGGWAEFAIAGPAAVLLAALVIGAMPEPPAWLWAAFPLGGVVMIALSDLATRDASVTAQIFLVFPVLYAGAQLPRHGALAITAVAALAEIVVTFSALPARVAFADATYVIAALVAAAALLVYSGERVDRLVARLQEQAAIDPLTGLATRRVLDSAASTALQSANSDGGTALLLVDVDHFKAVNDVHGHLAGDLVLQRVSDVLTAVGRRSDVVTRMGGDEFAILMPGCDSVVATDRAAELVRRVRDMRVDVGQVSMAHGTDVATLVAVTVSVGLAHLPTHARNVLDLYRAADLSLYRAKRGGRDRADGIGDSVLAG